MGKYLSVILGVVAMAFGIWGIVMTWPLLWKAILATVPAMCVLGGLLAVIIGIGEIRDSLESRRTQTQPTSSPAVQK